MEDVDDRAAERIPWLAAIGFGALVVAVAPFVGVLREWVREAVGIGYLRWVTAGLAVAAGAALLWALLRIRERRASRYGLLAVAAVLVALQVFGWGTGEAEVDTVERVHLLEFGLLGALFEHAFRARHRSLLLPFLVLSSVALVGLADEWVQWLTPVRVGDGRDVLLNAWAGAVGYLFAVAFSREGGRLRRPGRRTARLAAALGMAVIAAGAAFFDLAHLGHRIHDPLAGTFVSWHAPEALLRAGADRARRWTAGEPPPARPLALEDTFYTEAGWHAAARNEAVARGDLVQAWRENRILERWYAAYLELPGARWPQAQRGQIEASVRERYARRPERVERAPGYRSPALRRRIAPAPPRPLLWVGALAAAGLLAAAARRVA